MKIVIINGSARKGKKIGVLVPGGSPVDATQYELIKKQFECMSSYLDWNMLFYKPFYANGKDEIRNNAELVKELKEEKHLFQDGHVYSIHCH